VGGTCSILRKTVLYRQHQEHKLNGNLQSFKVKVQPATLSHYFKGNCQACHIMPISQSEKKQNKCKFQVQSNSDLIKITKRIKDKDSSKYFIHAEVEGYFLPI